MKKLFASTIFLAALFLAAQVIGQEYQTKGSGIASAAAAAESGKIYNGTGVLMATVDSEGYVRNPENRLIAQYSSTGEYFNHNRVKAGSMKKNVIYDRDGKKWARVTEKGDVISAEGKRLGNISVDGTVTDNAGKKIGAAPGVDKNILALLFFYQKSLTSSSPFSVKK